MTFVYHAVPRGDEVWECYNLESGEAALVVTARIRKPGSTWNVQHPVCWDGAERDDPLTAGA